MSRYSATHFKKKILITGDSTVNCLSRQPLFLLYKHSGYFLEGGVGAEIFSFMGEGLICSKQPCFSSINLGLDRVQIMAIKGESQYWIFKNILFLI